MEMAAMGLNKEGNELELLAVVEDEIELEATPDGEIQEKEVEKGPTMMSKEARDLFLNGDKNEALASWKVGVLFRFLYMIVSIEYDLLIII